MSILLRLSLFAALSGCCLLSAQAQAIKPTPTPTPATPTVARVPDVITLHIDKAVLSTEIARNDAQRQHGLMERPIMDDNAGMLFIMPKADVAIFWMDDTQIPLTIAYLDKNGVILEMYDMKPMDKTNIISKSNQITFAIEVNQHWYELNGIKVGDKVDVAPYAWSQFKPE